MEKLTLHKYFSLIYFISTYGIRLLFLVDQQTLKSVKKQLLLSLLLVCFGLSGYAQKFYPATLHYADGKTATYLVKVPLAGAFVVAKADEKGKKEKISSDLLKQVAVDGEEGEKIDYHFLPLNIAGKVKNKQWLQVLETGPVTLYGVGGSMMTTGPQRHKVEDVTYYARRTKEEAATFLGLDFVSGAMGVGVDKQFRKYAGEYFSDYQALATRIENKEFKISEVLLVIQEYNKWAKN